MLPLQVESTKTHYAKDLKYFLNLRAAVKQRYAESVDYSELWTANRQHGTAAHWRGRCADYHPTR